MEDHSKQFRQRIIAETPIESPLDVKRRAAIAYLGENWMGHPAYKFTPRHSFSVAGWYPHSVLRPIQLAAKQAGRI